LARPTQQLVIRPSVPRGFGFGRDAEALSRGLMFDLEWKEGKGWNVGGRCGVVPWKIEVLLSSLERG